MINKIKIKLLLSLLRWYRDAYFPEDGKEAAPGSVGHSLDDTIETIELLHE